MSQKHTKPNISPVGKPRWNLLLESFSITLFFFFLVYGYMLVNGGDLTVVSLRHVFGYVFFVCLTIYLSYPALVYFMPRLEFLNHHKKNILLYGFGYGIANVLLSITVSVFPQVFGQAAMFIPFAVLLLFVLVGSVLFLTRLTRALASYGNIEWDNLQLLGYLFIVINLAMTAYGEFPDWIQWFTKPEQLLPPITFPLSIFIIFMIGLRFHMENDKKKTKHTE
jgi:hypothetical protein